MNSHIRSATDIYSFNTVALRSALATITDEDAGRRWRNGDGSSITFILGHLMSSRTGLLKRFAETDENPFAELFGANTGAKDASAYPSMASLLESWDSVADRLNATFEGLTDEQILTPADGFPVPDQTNRGAIMFLAWHESYHLGQIGLMLTELDYPSVQAALYEALKG